MKKVLAILIFSVLVAAVPAHASLFALKSFTVTLHETDPGLVVWASPESGTLPPFELSSVGQSYKTDLFTIGTKEEALNTDDWKPYSIDVVFDFLLPSPGFGGSASGLSGAAWVFGTFGYVNWDAALVLNFGMSGQLGINLSDEKFGLPGSSTVEATFTLWRKDLPISTPEPMSGALLSLGVLGVLLARRRRASWIA